MMAGSKCPKWIVVYRGWNTVVSELLMVEGRKTVVMVGSEGMARGVECGGSYNAGHYS
jgi:hypothetical protein